MSLNSVDELRQILEVPGDVEDTSLEMFLADANLIITEDLAGKGHSTARLKTIERYIAAHFSLLLTERGGLTSSRQGESQDNYTSMSALGNKAITGFQLTRYGQQAISLDTSGTLAAMSKVPGLKAQMSVSSELENSPTVYPGVS